MCLQKITLAWHASDSQRMLSLSAGSRGFRVSYTLNPCTAADYQNSKTAVLDMRCHPTLGPPASNPSICSTSPASHYQLARLPSPHPSTLHAQSRSHAGPPPVILARAQRSHSALLQRCCTAALLHSCTAALLQHCCGTVALLQHCGTAALLQCCSGGSTTLP